MRIRTRVTTLLDAEGIEYRLLLHEEPVYTVEAAASQRGVSEKEMVKSILLRESKRHRYVMACLTGDKRLNPQAVRDHLPGEWKRLSFASSEEIRQATGYQMGAVSPLCLPDELPIVFDEGVARCERVNISSGDPLAGLELDTRALIDLVGARIAPIAEG